MAPMDIGIWLILALACIELIVFSALVGRGREKYGVPAPATSGNPDWERLNRVHQNSLEQMVVFTPLFFLYATFVGKFTALILGVVFLLARIAYAVGYAKAPEKRAAGSAATFLVQIWMAIGVVISLLWRFSVNP